MTPSNRNWAGDRQQYEHICLCSNRFFGHKGRLSCRQCVQEHLAGRLVETLKLFERYGFVATVAVNVTPLQPTGGGHLIEVRPARGHYHPSETLDEVVLKTSTHP